MRIILTDCYYHYIDIYVDINYADDKFILLWQCPALIRIYSIIFHLYSISFDRFRSGPR